MRAQANGVSTCANWLGNFLVVEITPPAFANIHSYTYLIFAATNLLIIAPLVYFFYPETARRSLEEIDLLFAEAWNRTRKEGRNSLVGTYVQHAATRPHITGRELELALQRAYAEAKDIQPDLSEKELKPTASIEEIEDTGSKETV